MAIQPTVHITIVPQALSAGQVAIAHQTPAAPPPPAKARHLPRRAPQVSPAPPRDPISQSQIIPAPIPADTGVEPARRYVLKVLVEGEQGINGKATQCFEKVEKRGRCGAITGAIGRCMYETASIIPNAIGGGLACLNTLACSVKACCTIPSLICTDIGYACCCGCLDNSCPDADKRSESVSQSCRAIGENMQITCVALGSIAKKVLCGIPLYLASRCCRKRVESTEDEVLRGLSSCCLSRHAEPSGHACYMESVRTMSGATHFKDRVILARAHNIRIVPAPAP